MIIIQFNNHSESTISVKYEKTSSIYPQKGYAYLTGESTLILIRTRKKSTD